HGRGEVVLGQGGVDVLQPVARHRDRDGRIFRHAPVAGLLEQAGHTAAGGGPAKTPASAGGRLLASKMRPCETASSQTPESSRAATARFQEAGAPMRIAVATVSGSGMGRPATKGAALSAWNPHIAGS